MQRVLFVYPSEATATTNERCRCDLGWKSTGSEAGPALIHHANGAAMSGVVRKSVRCLTLSRRRKWLADKVCATCGAKALWSCGVFKADFFRVPPTCPSAVPAQSQPSPVSYLTTSLLSSYRPPKSYSHTTVESSIEFDVLQWTHSLSDCLSLMVKAIAKQVEWDEPRHNFSRSLLGATAPANEGCDYHERMTH